MISTFFPSSLNSISKEVPFFLSLILIECILVLTVLAKLELIVSIFYQCTSNWAKFVSDKGINRIVPGFYNEREMLFIRSAGSFFPIINLNKPVP